MALTLPKFRVRGAPAIAIVGCLSIVVEILKENFSDIEQVAKFVEEKLKYLVSSRPTAVNMNDAAVKFTALVKKIILETSATVESVKQKIVEALEKMFEDDIATNKAIGQYGAECILLRIGQSGDNQVRILTHCNTGSLATAGYGTALGVIRKLHEMKKLDHAFCTETRPYNQGARLTAYELVFDKIPATLICDDMAAMVMQTKDISAVVTGADRVVKNGDTANKIGTYQLAILAKYHNIPFFVACPTTSFDPCKETGEEIIIEERPDREMLYLNDIRIAAEGIQCFNPAFDVTPAQLITGGIITEFGVFSPEQLYEELKSRNNLL
ncbi:methylthioribose-1-phosphate isomerase-like isoform X2 [Dreissena polymorpha]|uniref:methylthioribose-1-phosphate isomerase-like isoform X2 n=1 Tax=Dreissena polymorpha TaxID=45954 RepID=UPI002264BA75|nr:methylthioribose-1-phosphate isomerase-like isoform X2 [Dreissena polymorpha]